MEEFIEKLLQINDPKTLFTICGVFIFGDVLTGYLKALKNHKMNSSISRDGYIKKIGWVIALLIGYIIDLLVKVNMFLYGSAIICVTTEAISFYENLGEIGIEKLPFKKYFEKLNQGDE